MCIHICIWQVLNQHCAFGQQLHRASRQYRGWARGELLVPSAGGSGNLWTVRDSERTRGSLGPATYSPCFYIHFFWSFWVGIGHTSSFKSFNPFPQEKADRRVSLRNMNLLVATLSVYIFACEAAFPAPLPFGQWFDFIQCSYKYFFPHFCPHPELTDLWLLCHCSLLTPTIPVCHWIAQASCLSSGVCHSLICFRKVSLACFHLYLVETLIWSWRGT